MVTYLLSPYFLVYEVMSFPDRHETDFLYPPKRGVAAIKSVSEGERARSPTPRRRSEPESRAVSRSQGGTTASFYTDMPRTYSTSYTNVTVTVISCSPA